MSGVLPTGSAVEAGWVLGRCVCRVARRWCLVCQCVSYSELISGLLKASKMAQDSTLSIGLKCVCLNDSAAVFISDIYETEKNLKLEIIFCS